MDLAVLAAVVALAIALEKLFEALFGPLWKKFEWDNLYKLYAAMIVGSGVGFLTGLNAFPVVEMSDIAGRVLTALVIGVGPSFLYDLTDKPPTQ